MLKTVLICLFVITQQTYTKSCDNSKCKHQHQKKFKNWKSKHHPKWNIAQQKYRQILFDRNIYQIQQFNKKGHRYRKGINKFSTLTDEQFQQHYLNPKLAASYTYIKTTVTITTTITISTIINQLNRKTQSINWIEKGGVTPVKNQGYCGSCWAFSIIGSIQSHQLIHNRKLVDLSEQQLVDCSKSFGNYGCGGGWTLYGLNYIMQHGISFENQYPYTMKEKTCSKNGGDFRISKIQYARGCDNLQLALFKSPIAAAVDASNWRQYQNGILDICNTNVNHAILLVGFDDTFWLIKNSWGNDWGQDGYIKIASGNTCGICNYPGYYIS